MFSEPGTARQEAERLMAAVLAAASMAATARPDLSTGSAECCVCPLCKVIAAVRDPDPETVERLAAGAGDLAAGMASFLRHVAAASGAHRASRPEGPGSGTAPDPATPPPGRTAAKTTRKTVKKAVKKAVPKNAANAATSAIVKKAAPKKAAKKAAPKKAG